MTVTRSDFRSQLDQLRFHFGKRNLSVQLDVHQHPAGHIGIHRRRDDRLRLGLIALRSFNQLPKTEPQIFRNGGELSADIEGQGENAKAGEINLRVQERGEAAMETSAQYAT